DRSVRRRCLADTSLDPSYLPLRREGKETSYRGRLREEERRRPGFPRLGSVDRIRSKDGNRELGSALRVGRGAYECRRFESPGLRNEKSEGLRRIFAGRLLPRGP